MKDLLLKSSKSFIHSTKQVGRPTNCPFPYSFSAQGISSSHACRSAIFHYLIVGLLIYIVDFICLVIFRVFFHPSLIRFRSKDVQSSLSLQPDSSSLSFLGGAFALRGTLRLFSRRPVSKRPSPNSIYHAKHHGSCGHGAIALTLAFRGIFQ